MTIKTLEYIHRLLIAEEAKNKETYKAARKLQHDYEASEAASHELVESQTAAADELMHEHIKADNALEDFEAQEW